MNPAARILEALTSALFIALLAPAIAGLIFVVIAAVSTTATTEFTDRGVASILLLLFGAATGAYLLGVVPSFLAGIFLPTLRRRLSLGYAAAATGLTGTLFYFLTFGLHVFTQPNPLRTILFHAAPCFIGVAAAAAIHGYRTEA